MSDHPHPAMSDLAVRETTRSGWDTPGCDCGHAGMGPGWHIACAWAGSYRRHPWILRTGRKVGRTLYVQHGPGPDDGDDLIGMVDTRDLATLVVEAVNGAVRRGEAVIPDPLEL